MRNLKFFIILGTIFVSILGTLLHFVYNWSGNNAIVGLFVPVNESTWEHMKLVFFPMLIFSFYAINSLKEQYPCIDSAMALGTLVGTFLTPVLFYTYSGILGFNIQAIDISTFFISVLIAFWVAYKTTLSCSATPYRRLLNSLLFAVAVAFVIFTVFPPDIALFAIP